MENFEENPNQSSEPETQPTKKIDQAPNKTLKYLLWVLLIVIIASGGDYIYLKFFKWKSTDENTAVQTVTPSPEATETSQTSGGTAVSDSQLDSDLNKIDSDVASLDDDATNADSGLSDQQTDLN